MAGTIQRTNFISILLLSLCFIDCGSSPPKEHEKVIEEKSVAKQTGKTLHLYSALDTNEAKIYIRAFEEETGIDVRWVRMSAGEILVRVRSERDNPQVGVWFGGPSPEFIAAKQDGLLSPYKPKVDFELPPGTFDEDYYWTGFYFGALGFACNTDILILG